MEMNKDLIVTIFTPTSAKEGVIGTGYPIAEDLILTSRHVVEPEQRDKNYPLCVRWHHLNDQNEDDGWQKVLEDDLVWVGKGELDAALIRCPRPPKAVEKGWSWGRVVNKKPKAHTDWQSTGFSRATRYREVRKSGQFSGGVESMADDDNYFEITVTAPPDKEGLWAGASGMPVFVNGEILGVVR